MNERPFDPMDKILREALASDAQVPGDLTGRIMSRVADTPQQRAASRGNPYRKWFFSAAACLVLAAVALPLALNSHKNAADTATPDMCMTSAAPRDSGDTDEESGEAGNRDDSVQQNETTGGTTSKKDADGFTTVPHSSQTDPNDHPFDPIDAALDDADETLKTQGYTLQVLARSETAVQVAALDSSGNAAADPAVIENAMTAAGFTLSDGWYTIPQEVTP